MTTAAPSTFPTRAAAVAVRWNSGLIIPGGPVPGPDGIVPEAEPLIRAEGLTRRFGDVTALSGVSFSVHQGELFGFLGPNGAGKTTAIRIMTGLSRADSGSAGISGFDLSRDPKAAQHLIGVVPDDSNLYPELTGFENLCFCGALYGMGKPARSARASELLESFGLAEAAHRKFAGYSRGMKRKLTIAAGILHRPPVLFLDEPTTGIDVTSARQIRKLLLDLHAEGTTIFLTTHYIEEAERLCDRIAFIVGGRIVTEDTVKNLLQPVMGRFVTVFSFSRPVPAMPPAGEWSRIFPGIDLEIGPDGTLTAESPDPIPIGPLIGRLSEMGLEVMEARRRSLSLEDVFIRVTEVDQAAMKSEKEKGGARP
jgi:ABC-2 type transport system ATP-binding protein